MWLLNNIPVKPPTYILLPCDNGRLLLIERVLCAVLWCSGVENEAVLRYPVKGFCSRPSVVLRMGPAPKTVFCPHSSVGPVRPCSSEIGELMWYIGLLNTHLTSLVITLCVLLHYPFVTANAVTVWDCDAGGALSLQAVREEVDQHRRSTHPTGPLCCHGSHLAASWCLHREGAICGTGPSPLPLRPPSWSGPPRTSCLVSWHCRGSCMVCYRFKIVPYLAPGWCHVHISDLCVILKFQWLHNLWTILHNTVAL